ncbi:Lrp/AsnC ligand binding domain-containing protein [Actinocorallia herbida]|uniref:Lrp/AsnC ligand binding domain-containing protein n=1 Tax=Actinocorallia herbida TaxID=58109 RepID=UPI000F4CB665|nr:Lrp/AsnC ligand binding domain-containing protein [Actinocorallia herbida]
MSVVALVRVRLADGAAAEEFERWALRRPSVRTVWAIAGDDDYTLRVDCPDLAALNRELASLRRRGRAQTTHTALVLHELAPP